MTVADARAPDQPLTLVNDAFCVLSGYTRDEILGQNCRFLQGDLQNDEPREAIRSAIAQKQDVQVVLRNVRHSGDVFDNLLIIYALGRDPSDPDFFLGTQFDVTESTKSALDNRMGQVDMAMESVMKNARDLRYRTKHIMSTSTMLLIRAALKD